MKIKFLGSGSAFCDKKYNWQSNILIEHNGKRLLFDCGGDIRHSLSDIGLTSQDIDAIYISHQHADHAGGLEYMAFTTFFGGDHKIKLFGYRPMLGDLWDETLKGTLQQTAQFYDYFDIPNLKSSGFLVYDSRFNWQGLDFHLIPNDHCDGMCSYGLVVRSQEKKLVYISGDSKIQKKLSFNDLSDVIFHDCETMYKSGVHAHFDELKELPLQIKNKMYLYHYQDNVVINKEEWATKAKENGFLGFVERGEEFNF